MYRGRRRLTSITSLEGRKHVQVPPTGRQLQRVSLSLRFLFLSDTLQVYLLRTSLGPQALCKVRLLQTLACHAASRAKLSPAGQNNSTQMTAVRNDSENRCQCTTCGTPQHI